MAKFYNNIKILSEPKDDNDAIKKKNLTDALFEKKTREVVDSEAYYSLETDSTLAGVKQVVTTITDADKQILLTDVNTQNTPVDLTSLVGDGTEYLLYHDRVTRTEEYEESIYLPRSEVPESATFMTIKEFDDMWGTTEILPYTEV